MQILRHIEGMKVTVNRSGQAKSLTIRLTQETFDRLSEEAEKAEVSRQKIVEAILKKALEDKSFQIEITD